MFWSCAEHPFHVYISYNWLVTHYFIILNMDILTTKNSAFNAMFITSHRKIQFCFIQLPILLEASILPVYLTVFSLAFLVDGMLALIVEAILCPNFHTDYIFNAFILQTSCLTCHKLWSMFNMREPTGTQASSWLMHAWGHWLVHVQLCSVGAPLDFNSLSFCLL